MTNRDEAGKAARAAGVAYPSGAIRGEPPRMRIAVRVEYRRRIGRIDVDSAVRPTRATLADSAGRSEREIFLNWEAAMDDAGHLRRCVVCGCPDLFREKAFPQVTAFVVVLAFAGAALGALGYVTTPPMLIAMAVVLVLDTAILVFSRRRLVCYRCRSSYHDLPPARYHRPWDRSIAERYPPRRPPEVLAAPRPVQARRGARENVRVPAGNEKEASAHG